MAIYRFYPGQPYRAEVDEDAAERSDEQSSWTTDSSNRPVHHRRISRLVVGVLLAVVAIGSLTVVSGFYHHQTDREKALSTVEARVTSLVKQAGLKVAGFYNGTGIDHYGPTLPIIPITEGRNGAPDTAVV
jgi:hypothetical protein